MGFTKNLISRLSIHSPPSSPPKTPPKNESSPIFDERRSLDTSRPAAVSDTPPRWVPKSPKLDSAVNAPITSPDSHSTNGSDTFTRPPRRASLQHGRPEDVAPKGSLDAGRRASVGHTAKKRKDVETLEEAQSKEVLDSAPASGCQGVGHASRTDKFREIKEGEPRDDKYTYLKPVIHEKKHHHETEEITRVIQRHIHTHEVHIHELPIYRPREVATRAWLTIETEVLPLRSLAEEGITVAKEEDLAFHLEKSHKDCDPADLCKDGAQCSRPGAYQAYAQRVHDLAIQVLQADLARSMEKFERSLVAKPLSTAPFGHATAMAV
ncbi:hypothetical protein P7C70_g8154, partial [Phenoliferia sp. Uapishka_3]